MSYMPGSKLIYELADGRRWDTEEAAWLSGAAPANATIVSLRAANGQSDIYYLARTLYFYYLPLGELREYSIDAIRDDIRELEAGFESVAITDAEGKARYEARLARFAALLNRAEQLETTAPAPDPAPATQSDPAPDPAPDPEYAPATAASDPAPATAINIPVNPAAESYAASKYAIDRTL